MTFVELAEACNVYQCAEHPMINRHRVQHNDLATFAIRLEKFTYDFRDELSDEFWAPIARLFKHRRYFLQAVPLSFSAIAATDNNLADKVLPLIKRVRSVFPDMEEDVKTLLDLFQRLSAADDNPIGKSIQSMYLESYDASSHSAILIRDSRWGQAVEESFGKDKRFRKLHVISPEYLRDGSCYENLYCVGPAKWFQNHVFSAARASSIHLFCFNWIKDRRSIPNPFRVGTTEVTSPKSARHVKSEFISLVENSRSDDESIDAEDLVPDLNISIVKRRISETMDTDDYAQEVQARLFVLEGDALVMLEAESYSKNLVIDPLYWHDDHEGAEATVSKILTSEIEPGMFVLIRSGGGGDYIEPIANDILGGKAQVLRALQTEWKTLLRMKVKTLGVEAAIDDLQRNGSEKAGYVNLRNWMSARSIKTRDHSDFEALMNFIELGDRCEELWNAAETIHGAHRKAGFTIRKELIEKISQTSLKDLQKSGRAEFRIGASNEGSMLVLRVKKIVAEPFTVPESSVGKILEGSEDLWR